MDNWLINFKNFWLEKQVDKIIDLFDKKVIYYETPFEKVDDIKFVWNDILTQDINKLEYKIIGSINSRFVANFIIELSDGYICDMIYEIELNSNNKCTYFKQWYMENKGDNQQYE